MATHIINGEKIHTDYCQEAAFWGFPAWSAIEDSYDPSPIYYDDTPCCPRGQGSTEQEAIDDLMWQLEE